MSENNEKVIKKIIENKKYDHPMYGVYDKDGRRIELEADYNVKASLHQEIRSRVKLYSDEIASSISLYGGIAIMASLFAAIIMGYISKSISDGVFVFFVGFSLTFLAYIIFERIAFQSKVKELANYIQQNNIDIKEFMIIADRNLDKSSELRKYIIQVVKLIERQNAK